jgi:hypothetical protein
MNVVDLANRHAEMFTDEFLDWLPSNLHVWYAFRDETFRAIGAGYRRYSSKMIIHHLRHHTSVAERGSGFKISNNTSPYLPRLFDLAYPHLEGLFSYKEVIHE